jgi:hypothetical protein
MDDSWLPSSRFARFIGISGVRRFEIGVSFCLIPFPGRIHATEPKEVRNAGGPTKK